jgi:DNA invertase Pin-like site-specific DNA recombinase
MSSSKSKAVSKPVVSEKKKEKKEPKKQDKNGKRGRPRASNISENTIVEMYKKNGTASATAKESKLSIATVCKILVSHNIKLQRGRPKGTLAAKPRQGTKTEQIVSALNRGKLDVKTIAKRYKVSNVLVNSAKKKWCKS